VVYVARRSISTLIRLLELFFLLTLLLSLFLSSVRILLASASLAFFVMEYALYRYDCYADYKASLYLKGRLTKEYIRDLEVMYTERPDFNSWEKHALARTSQLERHFFFARHKMVHDRLLKMSSPDSTFLDSGCGFGKEVIFMSDKVSHAVGLDVDHLKITKAWLEAKSSGARASSSLIVGDCEHLPFREGAFDLILCTEVLEHLVSPDAAMRELGRVAKKGCKLLITVPSHHNLGYTSNPLILAEKLLSLKLDKVLPPYHELHGTEEFSRRRMRESYGIHRKYTINGLRRLLDLGGFKPLRTESFELEVPLYIPVELLSRDLRTVAKAIDFFERILEKIPVVRLLGQHLVLVSVKNGPSRN
jgi:ubiquinone/menaquinone biosynthesis C-methylase UbiE